MGQAAGRRAGAGAEAVIATTTFLFVDQVGSTEQLARIGETAAHDLRTAGLALLRSAVAQARGQEVDAAGDGLFCAFESASDAVEAAVTMLQLAWSSNQQRPADHGLSLRVGVHSGDPVERGDGGYFGLAVVVASRLCALAGSEQVLVSDVVRALVEPRGRHAFEAVGLRELKGVPEPVAVFSVQWSPPADDGPPTGQSGRARPAREVLLPEGGALRVGRAEDCDVVLDDSRISRLHLRIEAAGVGRWRVSDPGSRNGTFRDGRPLTEALLTTTTRLVLGARTDGVVLDLVPPAEATRAVASEARPRRVRIGRSPRNDLVLDHPTVSGEHAEVVFGAAGAEVTDLSSRNGVFVDGRRVRRAPLPLGALLTIGAVDLRLTAEGLVRPSAGAGTGGVVVEAVTVRRGGRDLLHDVSAHIPAGKLTAIVGPSGAGKSTLMSVLTGAVRPTSGRVLVDGRDVATAGDALRSRVGVVPQDDVLHTALTVRTSLRYSARLRMPADTPRDQQEAEIDRVLTALRLTEHADTRISSLSGGQRRRMNAASELLTKPSLLVLDEPTSGLDPHLERLIMGDLAALAAQGCTVVVITHSAATLHLADTVLAISGGRLVYAGAPAGLPQHFGARGLGTVFAEIGGPGAEQWADLWQARAEDPAPGTARADVVPPPAAARGRRQVRVLAERQLHLMTADRGSLALLLVQAPVLGLISRLYPLGGGFSESTAPNRDVRTVLLVLVLSATWLGTFAAVRQIVDERRIVERERAAGVSPLRYAAAKGLVLGALVVVQVLTLLVAGMAGRPLPHGRVLPGPGVELAATLVLTGWVAVAVGLLASALARSEAAASAMAPLIVIPQMLLCGGLTRVDRHVALDVVTRLVSSRAAFSATAASTGLARLERDPAGGPGARPGGLPPEWSATAATWWWDVTELAALGAVASALLWWALHHRRSAAR